MKDDLRKLQRQMSQDLQFITETLTNLAVDTNARFREMGQRVDQITECHQETERRLDALSKRTDAMAQQMAAIAQQMAEQAQQMAEQAQQMTSLSQLVGQNARYSVSLGDQMRHLGADSEERYNQVAGRMRLLDQRFETFLGLADRQLNKRYADLEKRVSRLEQQRQGPDDAVA